MSLRRLILSLVLLPLAVGAQNPVGIVAPAPPGGNLDNGARLLAQRLTEITGEPHVVENRPGANTQIGTEAVVRAAPDGRTMLYAGTGFVLLPHFQKIAFAPLTDLVPVAQVSSDQYLVVVPAASRVMAAGELAQLAAGRPQGINCAAYPGVSTIACAQLKSRLGGQVTTIPYPGLAPALNALLGGHADVMFVNAEPVQKLAAGGKVRVVAQTAGAGHAAPVYADVWPGFVLEGLSGVLVPAGTPPERIRQLNRDINRVLAEPEVAAHMREGGQEPAGGPPQRYAQALQRVAKLYGDIIPALGLRAR
jgi:tripartite-type tricarboxylate transporter receptor subunit TctC